MIDQHTKEFWLQEIGEWAHFMESLYREKKWNTELEFKTEKAVFIGAYSIRKLKENNHLNCKILGMNAHLFSYNARQGFDPDENEKWIRGYDHMNGKKECLSLETLCNQFIHSKRYSPFVPGGLGCVGFYFASDSYYKNKIFYVQLVQLVNIFLSVARGKVVKLSLDIEGSNIRVKDI